MCTCVQANMLTCLHAYMRTRVHACAYMFARLYALVCLDTTVFLHAYVLTCLLATPCSPTSSGSLFFQIFPALPTVPWGPGVPSQAPKLQNFNFLTYTCEPSVTGQGFLGAIIPCTAGNRISRGEPPTQLETTASFRLRLLQI